MIRVKDENGNIIHGIAKDKTGAVIVTDNKEFNKYKRQRELAEEQAARISELSSKVNALEQLVQQLIQGK